MYILAATQAVRVSETLNVVCDLIMLETIQAKYITTLDSVRLCYITGLAKVCYKY